MAQVTPSVSTEPSTSYIDPTFSLLNTSCLDLLLIELVPMAYRITADLAAREEEWIHGSSSKAGNKRLSGISNDASSTMGGPGAGGPVGGTVGGGTATVDEEEAREAVFHRLESLGYRVGLGVVERYGTSSFFTSILTNNIYVGSPAMPLAQQRHSTRSNFSAKTFGPCFSESKSTT